jgi:RNA polymerase sigma-70 factor (ECF subfamily)
VQSNSDATLVHRSANGDPTAFVELVRRHEQPLAALIRYRLASPDDAEDVFQETLLQAWVGIRRVREPGNVRAWLLQIARNRCRDFLKSSQRRDCPTDDRELETYVNRAGRAVARADETATEALAAIGEVPAAERVVAELFYLHGLTISEIARRSRCPEGTVKRRLFAARQHLRRTMGAGGGEEK